MAELSIVESKPLPDLSIVESKPLKPDVYSSPGRIPGQMEKNQGIVDRGGAPEGGPVSRFASEAIGLPGLRGLWDSVTQHQAKIQSQPLAQTMKDTAAAPLEFIKGIGSQQGEQAKFSMDALKRGDRMDAFGHGLAATVPVLGPAAAKAGEKIAGGDVAGGLGAGVNSVMQVLAPRLISKGLEAIPSTARAAENFQAVHQAVGNAPMNTGPSSAVALEALDRLPPQGSVPPTLARFADDVTNPGRPPMNFQRMRDYQSGAGRMSVSDYMASNPASRRYMSQFAGTLGDATQQAADTAGVGPLYKGALREYQNASRVKNAVKTATGGGVLAYGARKAKQMGVKLP